MENRGKEIIPSAGNLVDLEFDAISCQYKHLADERNGHSVWEELRIQSHVYESERESEILNSEIAFGFGVLLRIDQIGMFKR